MSLNTLSDSGTENIMLSDQTVKGRPPAVSGQFYPADPAELGDLLLQLLEQAQTVTHTHVKALIAPHAGFIYSGPIAASAFQCLIQQAKQIRRVILLGPSHRVGFHGIATISSSEYLMPQGNVKIDRAAIELIEVLSQVQQMDKAHAMEHSLEVQLPFLQTVLDKFTLVPLVVGDCAASQVAEVLELLWGGDETLIVISSDLSHFNSYEVAKEQDQRTTDSILTFAPENIQYEDACGRNPVNGLLIAAKAHKLKPVLVDYRNSGDTAGTHDRVVGYGSYLFCD